MLSFFKQVGDNQTLRLFLCFAVAGWLSLGDLFKLSNNVNTIFTPLERSRIHTEYVLSAFGCTRK